jgi:hypothetical protein
MISEQIAKRHLKTSAELQHLNCSCDGCAKHLATVINDTVEDELKTRSEIKAKEEAAKIKAEAEAEAAKQVASEATKVEEAVVAE